MDITENTVLLNDGNRMPLMGFGTYKIVDANDIENDLDAALSAGYRLIDTAFLYDNEAHIGKALSVC